MTAERHLARIGKRGQRVVGDLEHFDLDARRERAHAGPHAHRVSAVRLATTARPLMKLTGKASVAHRE